MTDFLNVIAHVLIFVRKAGEPDLDQEGHAVRRTSSQW